MDGQTLKEKSRCLLAIGNFTKISAVKKSVIKEIVKARLRRISTKNQLFIFVSIQKYLRQTDGYYDF